MNEEMGQIMDDFIGLVDRYINLQEEYIKMLGRDLGETVKIAHVHGWRSSQVEYGKRLRGQMAEAKEAMEKFCSL